MCAEQGTHGDDRAYDRAGTPADHDRYDAVAYEHSQRDCQTEKSPTLKKGP